MRGQEISPPPYPPLWCCYTWLQFSTASITLIAFSCYCFYFDPTSIDEMSQILVCSPRGTIQAPISILSHTLFCIVWGWHCVLPLGFRNFHFSSQSLYQCGGIHFLLVISLPPKPGFNILSPLSLISHLILLLITPARLEIRPQFPVTHYYPV